MYFIVRRRVDLAYVFVCSAADRKITSWHNWSIYRESLYFRFEAHNEPNRHIKEVVLKDAILSLTYCLLIKICVIRFVFIVVKNSVYAT